MKYMGLELIRALSLAFGPSGCEDAVRALIREQIEDCCDTVTVDKAGNLLATIRGRGVDYRPGETMEAFCRRALAQEAQQQECSNRRVRP